MYRCRTTEIQPPPLRSRGAVISGHRQRQFNDVLKENVMSDKTKSHSKWLHIRLKEDEFDRIQKKFKQSTDRKLSQYARKVLLNKPITVNQRNQSLDDFMHEMIALRNELNAIGNNYNQTVKRLHTLEDFEEIKIWLSINETARQIIQNKVAEIKEKINQINDIWLR
jgi:glutaminase